MKYPGAVKHVGLRQDRSWDDERNTVGCPATR
jgi:hypothetical protein